MPAAPCSVCARARAVILRPKNRQAVCKTCFLAVFEAEVHDTIASQRLFSRGEAVAIGASGGKDSTVLASVLCTLNARHDYGLRLSLLSVDEGIAGYRDDSLESVKRNARDFGLPLTIVGYKELYGWTMDEVVAHTGKKGNCTYCGVFRRQALDRGAQRLGVNHVVTGHNADDVAETVMMNLLRGDLPRLSRATSIVTASASSPIKRSKPLKYAYEKEIVLYAHHKKLDYFSTECIYSPEAFRGSARALIKNLERIRPSAILDVVRSGEDMARYVPTEVTTTTTNAGGCAAGEEAKSGGDTGDKTTKMKRNGHAKKTRNAAPARAQEEEDEEEDEEEEEGEDAAEGSCGSAANGRASGGEMADMERRLRENERAEEGELEVEFTSSSISTSTRFISKKEQQQQQQRRNRNGDGQNQFDTKSTSSAYSPSPQDDTAKRRAQQQQQQQQQQGSSESAANININKKNNKNKNENNNNNNNNHKRTPKKLPRQQMGQCQRCGYMSSQAICKACTLLEGLNRNRPRTEIEVSAEDEESSSTLMRAMESVVLAGPGG